jgi:hypothetical protein
LVDHADPETVIWLPNGIYEMGPVAGTTQIGVSNTTGFAVGDMVLLQMDDATENCELIDSVPTQASRDRLQRELDFW